MDERKAKNTLAQRGKKEKKSPDKPSTQGVDGKINTIKGRME